MKQIDAIESIPKRPFSRISIQMTYIYIPTRPRNVKVELKVNSIETESENGIFLFIPCTPCALGGCIYMRIENVFYTTRYFLAVMNEIYIKMNNNLAVIIL